MNKNQLLSKINKVDNAGSIIEDKYQVMHNGLLIHKGCYNGEWMTNVIKDLNGHHEPQEELCFDVIVNSIKKDNPTMIELGSFWSYYSMWFNKVTNGTNYMFEPIKSKMDIGRSNFELNNLTNGVFTNASISKNYIKEHTFIDWDKSKHIIPQLNVETIIKQNDIDFIDILHCDIQGYEYDMLQGIGNNLDKIHYMFISTHNRNNAHKNCLDWFNNNNFHIIAQHTIAESLSQDGLIVVRNKQFKGINKIEI